MARTGDGGGDRSGTTCGRWTLEERASSTLIADTYVAIGRKNARALVEVVRPAFSADGSLTAAFRRESLATARVRHPALPPILDDGSTDDGVPWVARLLPAGVPLSSELLRDRPSNRLASGGPVASSASRRARMTEVAGPLGDALVHAHRLGVIHGDLRPENLFCEPATLLGFVGAEIVARIPPEQRPIPHLAYAAPETARGELPDARADQFAFAAVLAAILFGGSLRRPTTLRSALQCAKEEPYSTLLAGRNDLGAAGAGVLEVLARALELRREDRFADISEFLSALVRTDFYREARSTPAAPLSEPPESARVISDPVAASVPRKEGTKSQSAELLLSLNLPQNLPHFSFPPIPSFPPEVAGEPPAPSPAVLPPLEPAARRPVPSLLPPGTVRPVPSPLPPVPSLLPARPSSPRMQIPVPLLELPKERADGQGDGAAPALRPATGSKPVSIHDAELEAARQNGPRSDPPGPLRSSDPARGSRSLPRISTVQLSLAPPPSPRTPILPWVVAAISVVVAIIAVLYRAK
jgi:serine/threonine protein kinase